MISWIDISKLLITLILLASVTGCATLQRVGFPRATLAMACAAWDPIKPSRKDSESTLRQVRDAPMAGTAAWPGPHNRHGIPTH